MRFEALDADGLTDMLGSPHARADLAMANGVAGVVIDPQTALDRPELFAQWVATAAVVTMAAGVGPLAEACDLQASGADLAAAMDGVAAHPLASFALVRLLRGADTRTINDGLAAESAVYSMLQAGPEFQAWRAANPPRPPLDDDTPRVFVDRDGETLLIELNRPERHNALDAALRDELYDALLLAAADDAIHRIVLRGRGPSFCSGGDVDTFGTAPDPATAHTIRLARSIGAVLAEISARVEVHLHGACLGAGIELPAFCGKVTAAPDTTFGLPEVGLGLIPGAGGTASIPRRIGRQRTVWWAITGARIDHPTALAWGLIDA